MRLVRCTKYEMNRKIGNRRIVVFGGGKAAHSMFEEDDSICDLLDNIAFFVDNSLAGESIVIAGHTYKIYNPAKIMMEEECAIIISSSMFMYDMYRELVQLGLSDRFECYIFPLIRINNIVYPTVEEHKKLLEKKLTIPKQIHTFWFSGENIPYSYKRCIDSWRSVCPEYEIKVWTAENYDVYKNDFVSSAYKMGKWAFIADYARLDVIYNYGGIYMDMDVELLSNPHEILCRKAVFSFDMNDNIDLAFFSSVPQNFLLKNLMELYTAQIMDSDKDARKYLQPKYIRKKLQEYGIAMNGKLQWRDEMCFLPRTYFMPMDATTYELNAKSQYTYGIHRFNTGWIEEKTTRSQISKNRELWRVFQDGDCNLNRSLIF